MAILAKTGVLIHHPEALAIFQQNGAKIDGEKPGGHDHRQSLEPAEL